MDTLTITDLELQTRIGAPEEERAQSQKLLLSIEMHLDTRAAGQIRQAGPRALEDPGAPGQG